MAIWKINRRSLLISASGVVAVAGCSGLWLGARKLDSLKYRKAVKRSAGMFTPSVYLAVDESGTTTIWVIRSEMGQGVSTALPMLIAEEMDADWSRVTIEQAATGSEHDYGPMFTAASSSIASEWIMLRRAGATAREMLIAAAAQRWGVSATACVTDSGHVECPKLDLRAGYGELALAAHEQWAPLRPRLKAANDFKLIGRPVHRLDVFSKINGTAVYGVDVALPGMLRAVIKRPPAFGDRVAAIDASATLAVSGVREVISLTSGVAVVAESTFAALQGRTKLQVEWVSESEEQVSDGDIESRLKVGLGPGAPSVLVQSVTNDYEPDKRNKIHKARYLVPYLPHACMEPMNCTAVATSDHCEIWVPTQMPAWTRRTAATVSGLPLESVTVHVTQLGGGFGRRSSQDFVSETVELAMQLSAPVQVLWTREDDFRNASYRPAAAIELQAELNARGMPVGWQHRIACGVHRLTVHDGHDDIAVRGAKDLPYRIASMIVEWRAVELPIPVTMWRSVGASFNTFAVESFLDELAEVAVDDPVEFRLKLLNESLHVRHVLERVASLSGWPGVGAHLGVAVHHLFGDTAVAMVVEVAPDPSQAFRVCKVWCVVDCGIVVNPDIARAQLEGGIMDGLSVALYGGLSISDNAVQQGNFHRYRMLRMDQAPEIEIELIHSNRSPSGLGEASLPAVAPALANAVFSLTGKRMRTLPMLG